MNQEIYFKKALEFIHSIGIETEYLALQDRPCFLPGLLVENGRILIDTDLLLYPGDLLHEAAHVALTTATERSSISGVAIGKSKDAAAEEIAAIAWTYAACVYLEIDPCFVFHGNGYQGGGDNIAENFKEGRYIGVPILQWFGMTETGRDNHGYPTMLKWKRD